MTEPAIAFQTVNAKVQHNHLFRQSHHTGCQAPKCHQQNESLKQ